MTRRTLLLSVAVLAGSAALAGCSLTLDIDSFDPGDPATVSRPIGAVSSVELGTAGNMTVSVGDEPSLTITAGQQVLDRLKTEVRGDTLTIELPGSWPNPGRIDYELVLPSLSDITLSGSGGVAGEIGGTEDVTLHLRGSGGIVLEEVEAAELTVVIDGSGAIDIDDVTASATEVTVRGSGAVSLAGTTDTLDVSVPGSGDLDLSDLVADDAVVQIDGSGQAVVNATGSLDAAINGSGDIRYLGDPDLTSQVAGSGTIQPA